MASKIKNSFLRNSQCKGKWLHRFKIAEEYPTGIMEECEVCKMRKFFKLVDGKADNMSYMDWHIRSALPPNHPFYYHEYPQEEILSPYAKQ